MIPETHQKNPNPNQTKMKNNKQTNKSKPNQPTKQKTPTVEQGTVVGKVIILSL